MEPTTTTQLVRDGYFFAPCTCGDVRHRCTVELAELAPADLVAVHIPGEGCKVYRVDVLTGRGMADCTPAEQVTPGSYDVETDTMVSPAFRFARESFPVPMWLADTIVLRRAADWQD